MHMAQNTSAALLSGLTDVDPKRAQLILQPRQ